MKKFLKILFLISFLNPNVYAENADQSEINLTCTNSEVGIPASVIINTELKKVSFQGSDPDSYYLKNDVFIFSMLAGEYTYSYHLNRNTGLLIIKAYVFSKEQKDQHVKEAFDTMVANKQIDLNNGTYDAPAFVKLIFERYEKEKPKENIFMQCKKTKAKF